MPCNYCWSIICVYGYVVVEPVFYSVCELPLAPRSFLKLSVVLVALRLFCDDLFLMTCCFSLRTLPDFGADGIGMTACFDELDCAWCVASGVLLELLAY